MKKLNKKGFTIVELVIVIAVIAILAGVLIPTFATVVDKANKSSAQQQAKNFYTLLEAATAAPTKYEMTGSAGNQNQYKTTYTLSMQKTGLVVSKTYTGDQRHADAAIMLMAILGDDVKTYNGAKVGIDESLARGDSWTIKAVYFQPNGSKYVVKSDLVAGTVGEAGAANMPINHITLNTTN